MDQQFSHLFEPLKLRQKTLKNRIVFVPHETHLAKNRLPSDGHVFYHRERAKGGVGTSTVALNVAARLAHQQHRVILAELRPSGGVFRQLLRFKNKPTNISPLLSLDPDRIKRPEIERSFATHP